MKTVGDSARYVRKLIRCLPKAILVVTFLFAIIVATVQVVTFTTERTATAEQINPTLKNAPASYIGNVNSGVFHSDTCASLPQEQNQITFDTYEAAIAAGYRPHKKCLP